MAGNRSHLRRVAARSEKSNVKATSARLPCKKQIALRLLNIGKIKQKPKNPKNVTAICTKKTRSRNLASDAEKHGRKVIMRKKRRFIESATLMPPTSLCSPKCPVEERRPSCPLDRILSIERADAPHGAMSSPAACTTVARLPDPRHARRAGYDASTERDRATARLCLPDGSGTPPASRRARRAAPGERAAGMTGDTRLPPRTLRSARRAPRLPRAGGA